MTLLSSFGQKTLTTELSVNKNIDDYVGSLAKIAVDAGLNGVVASASEAIVIRKECPEDFIIVCPAIRPTWSVVSKGCNPYRCRAFRCGLYGGRTSRYMRRK